MTEYEYQCKQCKEIWEFEKDIYDRECCAYPIKCPLCSMPLRQMISDVYTFDGLMGVLKTMYKRYWPWIT